MPQKYLQKSGFEQGGIGLREASRYYGISARILSRGWKSDDLAEKRRLSPTGMSSLFMWKAFALIIGF
jgi:hypothetical protein